MDKNGGFPVRKLLVDQRVTPQIFGTAMSKSGVTRGHQALWKGLLRWKELPSGLCLCFNLPRPNRTCWNCRRLKIHIISHHLTLKEKCRTSFETDVPYSTIFIHILSYFPTFFPSVPSAFLWLSTSRAPEPAQGASVEVGIPRTCGAPDFVGDLQGIFLAENQRFSIEETCEKKHQPFNHYGIYPLVISQKMPWKMPWESTNHPPGTLLRQKTHWLILLPC